MQKLQRRKHLEEKEERIDMKLHSSKSHEDQNANATCSYVALSYEHVVFKKEKCKMEKAHNYVYKITNTINNMYYIGKHSTDNLNEVRVNPEGWMP